MRHPIFVFLISVNLAAAIQTSQTSFYEDPVPPGGHPDLPGAVSEGTQLKIPLQLVMTAKSGGIDDLPMKQRRNARKTLALNSGLKLRFLTDDTCRHFIEQNYGAQLLSAFENEKEGSFRGDICRAAVIALEGGFYADLDVQFRVPLVDLVNEQTTFMSVLDVSQNVLNAVFAAERGSEVMTSVIGAIEEWYSKPKNGTYEPMGTVTMLHALNDMVSRGCPGLNVQLETYLQFACGPYHQFRFYREKPILCFGSALALDECPDERKSGIMNMNPKTFDGTQYGIFEPGPKRKMVAWSRFADCTKWGCQD